MTRHTIVLGIDESKNPQYLNNFINHYRYPWIIANALKEYNATLIYASGIKQETKHHIIFDTQEEFVIFKLRWS